ncbi:hypothetical protein OROHE_027140 [Orobanche hederae]
MDSVKSFDVAAKIEELRNKFAKLKVEVAETQEEAGARAKLNESLLETMVDQLRKEYWRRERMAESSGVDLDIAELKQFRDILIEYSDFAPLLFFHLTAKIAELEGGDEDEEEEEEEEGEGELWYNEDDYDIRLQTFQRLLLEEFVKNGGY